MKIIKRDYLEQLINLIGTPDIKVITGIRRSGKSILLSLFSEYVLANVKDANIIHVDFLNIENIELQDYLKLNKYVESKYVNNKHNFLFIDEVQLCKKFEVVINSLHSLNKYDIYITGSNAFLLSSDLATLFTGRVYAIQVYPFSYKEFLDYYDGKNSDENFEKYTKIGGLSGAYSYRTEDEQMNYVKGVFEAIMNRDLCQKKRINNENVLRVLTNYLMDNVSNITSIRKITNALNHNGIKVEDKTIGSYVNYLCNSFLFYKVYRYDLRGKKYLNTNDKYYLCDHAFNYAILGRKSINYGRIYENIVAIELLRRGYEIYVGVLYSTEIDFVAVKRDERIYIQVSDDITNEDTFNREANSLLKINDAYPKVIIARTHHDYYLYKGIKVIDIADWLLDK